MRSPLGQCRHRHGGVGQCFFLAAAAALSCGGGAAVEAAHRRANAPPLYPSSPSHHNITRRLTPTLHGSRWPTQIAAGEEPLYNDDDDFQADLRVSCNPIPPCTACQCNRM